MLVKMVPIYKDRANRVHKHQARLSDFAEMQPILYKDSKYFLYHITAAVLCATFLAFFASCSSNRKVTHPSQSDRNYRYEQTDRKTDDNSSYTPIGRDGTAQRRHYVATFADAAIRNRERYGIPAAITLGQGILESAGGTSYLATKGNNHFGIKASSDWDGRTICKPGESVKYRKYASVADCFADHARFLSRKRYAPLFRLKITDYKGWARKLKECGYATDPNYASKLIKVIETYNLQSFDR